MVNEVCDERQNKIRNRYFSCTCYSQYGTGRYFKPYIRCDMLYVYLLAWLQHWMEQAQLDRGQRICELQKNLGSEQAAEIGQMQSEQARAENAARKSTGCLHGCMKTGRLEYSAAAPVSKMNR